MSKDVSKEDNEISIQNKPGDENTQEPITLANDKEDSASKENSTTEVVNTQPTEAVQTTETKPQVIIQKERGFAHYVGFALLCVLCIVFFFMPGISITYLASLIPGISLGAIAAWVFSVILSIIIWLIFKIKIKGFKKSFYFYIGLCVIITVILTVIEILTENTNLFAEIFALLAGVNT